jgi:hypothetical protein
MEIKTAIFLMMVVICVIDASISYHVIPRHIKGVDMKKITKIAHKFF